MQHFSGDGIIKRKMIKKAKILFLTLALTGVFMAPMAAVATSGDSKCATILQAFCPSDGDNGEAIINLVKFVINMLAAGVVVAGTIGIVICAVMWITAGSSTTQVEKAKKRLLEIVIGMALFVMIDVIINTFV